MTHPGSTFDERRVLDELEQLELAIRASREKRERVQADFDAQLRAFEPLSLPRTPSAPPRAASIPMPGPVEPEPARPVPSGSAAVSEVVTGERPQPVASPSSTPDASRGPSRRLLVGLAAAAVVVSFAVVRVINRTPDARPPSSAQRQTAPAAAVGAPPPPPASKPVQTVDPHPLRIDLTTLRRVWLRVAVDGRIAIEREVAAGEQLPFGADRSIVVRAGDAGAVTVSVGGADQGPIGHDGQVLTRSFAAPAR
jgi:hypothetical protein